MIEVSILQHVNVNLSTQKSKTNEIMADFGFEKKMGLHIFFPDAHVPDAPMTNH